MKSRKRAPLTDEQKQKRKVYYKERRLKMLANETEQERQLRLQKGREVSARFREKHPQKARESVRIAKEKDLEKAREAVRRWRRENQEKARKLSEDWRNNNKERHNARCRRWFRQWIKSPENREKLLESRRERRRIWREENPDKVWPDNEKAARKAQEQHRTAMFFQMLDAVHQISKLKKS